MEFPGFQCFLHKASEEVEKNFTPTGEFDANTADSFPGRIIIIFYSDLESLRQGPKQFLTKTDKHIL